MTGPMAGRARRSNFSAFYRLAVFALALLAGACGQGQRIDNVLLVTLDTTRADRFGCYGYEAAHTPNFDQFCETAVRFDNAISAVPVTLPSHTTILTGTYPIFHGVRDNDEYRVDDALETLAERLKAKDFETAAFVAAAPLLSQNNLDQGFDVYDDDFGARTTDAGIDAFGLAERSSDAVNAAVERWLEGRDDGSFFAWVHYFDPHQPYVLNPPFDSLFPSSPYDAEMAFMDESFGELLELFESRGLDENTLVVIVGDHGESLFEHEEPTHASYLFNSTLRVPLMVRSPNHVDRAGTAVSSVARTLDVTPTILDLLGLTVEDPIQGQSLRPSLEGDSQPDLVALSETYYSFFHYNWAPTRALTNSNWKVIEGPKPQLYDLANDPDELRDLAPQQPERAADLIEQLRRASRRHQSGKPERSVATQTDPDVARQLRALGYLSGGGGDAAFRAVTFPDPSELAGMEDPSDHHLELLYANVAAEMLRGGNYGETIRAARAGLAKDPGNPSLREFLSRGLAADGFPQDALVEVRELIEMRPNHAALYRLEAHINSSLSDDSAVVQSLTKLLELNAGEPSDLLNLSRAYARLREHSLAVDHFNLAAAMAPLDSPALVDQANSLVELGRSDEAVASYQAALDLAPGSVYARFYVGQFYLAQGNLDFAAQMFEESLQIDPNHAGSYFFLATVRNDQGGEADEVRRLIEEVLRVGPSSRWARQAEALRDSLSG